MRRSTRTALLCALVALTASSAQTQRPADVATKDGIIAALYDVISGPAGQARDWDRMASLFHPTGRLMAVARVRPDSFALRVLTPAEYAASSGAALTNMGFREMEVGRHEIQYGQMVHIASAYEATRELPQPGPATRGVNSIQLLFDGKRWWIVSVYWDGNPSTETWPPSWVGGR